MLKPTAELVAPASSKWRYEPGPTERFDQQSLHNCASGVNNFPFKVNGPTIYRVGVVSARAAVELKDRADRTKLPEF